MTQVFVIVER